MNAVPAPACPDVESRGTSLALAPPPHVRGEVPPSPPFPYFASRRWTPTVPRLTRTSSGLACGLSRRRTTASSSTANPCPCPAAVPYPTRCPNPIKRFDRRARVDARVWPAQGVSRWWGDLAISRHISPCLRRVGTKTSRWWGAPRLAPRLVDELHSTASLTPLRNALGWRRALVRDLN